MAKRPPWGHVSRHCVHCGKVGPRTRVLGGWAHKRCIYKPWTERQQRAMERARECSARDVSAPHCSDPKALLRVPPGSGGAGT